MGESSMTFFGEIVAALRAFPLTGPLLRLAASRKAVIASVLTGFILEGVPKLAPVGYELEVFLAQVVGLIVSWGFVVLGIAYEDAAEKSAGGPAAG